MMRSDASLHPNQTRRHIGKASVHLATRPLLTQHDRTAIIKGYDVEGVLSNIDANYADRVLCCCCRRSVSLVWAPLTSLSLAGQEHGRTIPLAEIIWRFCGSAHSRCEIEPLPRITAAAADPLGRSRKRYRPIDRENG